MPLPANLIKELGLDALGELSGDSLFLAMVIVLVIFGVYFLRIMRPLWEKRLEIESRERIAQIEVDKQQAEAMEAQGSALNQLTSQLQQGQETQGMMCQNVKTLSNSLEALERTLVTSLEVQQRSQGTILAAVNEFPDILEAMEKRLVKKIEAEPENVRSELRELRTTVNEWASSVEHKLNQMIGIKQT